MNYFVVLLLTAKHVLIDHQLSQQNNVIFDTSGLSKETSAI